MSYTHIFHLRPITLTGSLMSLAMQNTNLSKRSPPYSEKGTCSVTALLARTGLYSNSSSLFFFLKIKVIDADEAVRE